MERPGQLEFARQDVGEKRTAETERVLGSIGSLPLSLQLHVRELSVDGKRITGKEFVGQFSRLHRFGNSSHYQQIVWRPLTNRWGFFGLSPWNTIVSLVEKIITKSCSGPT